MGQATPIRRAGDSAGPARLIVEHCTRLDQLHSLVPEWERLAAHAAEPNIFYEPWMMLASLEQFSRRLRLDVVAVHVEESGGRRLVGLFPFERSGGFGRLGAVAAQSLRYYYCSLCTPLVAPEYGAEAVAAALAALRVRYASVEFKLVAADGPVYQWLERAAASEPGFHAGERTERAFLRRYRSAQAYVADSFRREAKKKDLARLERRLAKLGALRMYTALEDEPLEFWLDEFLALEAKGWKGREGTALAAVAGGSEFFRRICREAHDRGRLETCSLRLDGKAIAMICFLRVADGLIFLRTAYDEDYARHSPGLLLAFKFTCLLHEKTDIAWLDSCSDPGAIMSNRVWKQRRPLAGFRIVYRPQPVLSALFGAVKARFPGASG
ncbi:MAG: GNAT family N-acetyltransferase [Xanthomonadaceae bacterium]|nr:GNAT family N-acetyltransferase [Xanthomonadaceae bacterium]